ncbi:MAG: sulfotransferase family protein [Egibacteraceae bacterium]
MSASSAPIFIVSAMRSGSTLLRLCLDSHERIAIGPESGFMGAVAAMKSIPDWDAGPGWYERYGLCEDEMNERIREFFSGVFTRYAAERGKARWGDKTPFHTWHVRQMASIFPDAQFIGIVRHPSATLASMRRWHYSAADSVSKWVRANSEIVRQAASLGSERFAVCRYEDLALHPEPTLRALLDFLGEPWSDRVLTHDTAQREQDTPDVVEGGTRPGDAIDASRVGRWQGTLAPDELAMIAKRVPRALLDILGYDPRDPHPLVLPGALVPVERADLSRLPEGKYAAGDFDPDRRSLPTDPAELAHRLQKAERALERMTARPAARAARALRQLRRRSAQP